MTMKKNLTKPVIAVLLGALTFSSCIGSFSLTNSVLNWNKRATDTKFVNEIIFVLISREISTKIISFTNLVSVALLFQLSTEFVRLNEPMQELKVKAPNRTAMTGLVKFFFIVIN